MIRNGFSLIETLIYTALLALLCLIAFSWVNKSAHSVSKITQTTKQLMMAQAILMRLASDVQMADAARAQWNATDQELRLYHAKTPIIWRTDKNKLYRIENKSKALIGTEIIQFTHIPIKEGARTVGIKCTLALPDVSLSHTMRIYNG